VTGRSSTIHLPVWVRIPALIALVLVAVVLGAMLLGIAGAGSDPGGGMDHNQDQTGGHNPAGGRGH
jgi:hypothetical protein